VAALCSREFVLSLGAGGLPVNLESIRSNDAGRDTSLCCRRLAIESRWRSHMEHSACLSTYRSRISDRHPTNTEPAPELSLPALLSRPIRIIDSLHESVCYLPAADELSPLPCVPDFPSRFGGRTDIGFQPAGKHNRRRTRFELHDRSAGNPIRLFHSSVAVLSP
jgi:hypothetical protein